MGTDSESTRLRFLLELARQQGVEPTEDDLRAVLPFLDAIQPELARLETLLAAEPDE